MKKWQVKWSDDEYAEQTASFNTKEEARKWIQSSLAREKIEPTGFEYDSPQEVDMKPFEAGKLYRVNGDKYILVVSRSDSTIRCLDVTASTFKAFPKVIVSRVEQAPDGAERATSFDGADSLHDFCDPADNEELYAMMKKNDVARAFLQKAGVVLEEDQMLPSKRLILGDDECTRAKVIQKLLELRNMFSMVACWVGKKKDQQAIQLFDELVDCISQSSSGDAVDAARDEEFNPLQESISFLKEHLSNMHA